jgi:hypothetical protein
MNDYSGTCHSECSVPFQLEAHAVPEAGLTDHVWSLEELVGLLEQREAEIAA